MSARLYDRCISREPQELVGLFENILQASTEYSIIGTALDGTIELWNEGARRVFAALPDSKWEVRAA
jgi:hypothetical protein